MVVHTFVVVQIPILGGEDTITFLVGFSRPYEDPCTVEVSDSECIKLLTFDLSGIESFWSDRRIRVAKLSLLFSYLAFTGSFGALVGVLFLRERKGKLRKRRAESVTPNQGVAGVG